MPQLPNASLPLIAAHILRDEAEFAQSKLGIRVENVKNGLTEVMLELPEFVTSDSLRASFMAAQLPDVQWKPRGEDVRHVTVDLYAFRDAIMRLKRPLSHRTLIDGEIEKPQRHALEDEYARMLGIRISHENENIDHDAPLAETLKTLIARPRIPFERHWKDGMLNLPVKEPESYLFAIIVQAQRAGLLPERDVRVEKSADGVNLQMTAAGFKQVNTMALSGITLPDGQRLPPVTSEEATNLREAYKQNLRIQEVLKCLPKQDTPTPGAHEYDRAAMQAALGKGFAMLDENRYWSSLEASQIASGSNTIRVDLKRDLSDISVLLAEHQLTQPQLQWLVNHSPYADALRDTGHLLSVIQDSPKKQRADAGAKEWQQAFNLTQLSMQPKSENAKEASYHLRSSQGQIGIVERVKSNMFMGIRPIWHSIELAFEKPMLVGGAIAGISAYSAMVPRKYSIPHMLNKLVHDSMEYIGLHHHDHDHGHDHAHDHGSEHAHEHASAKPKTLKMLSERTKLTGKEPLNFKTGYKVGFGNAIATLGAAFVIFNMVEDVVVHVPLALVSVGVGAAGGATGRAVVKPILQDLGDIAGRTLPDPVRESFEKDWKRAEEMYSSSPAKKIHRNIVNFWQDVDDLGPYTAALGIIQKPKKRSEVLKQVMEQDAPAQAAGGRT